MIRGIWAIVVLDIKRAWIDRIRIVFGLAQPLLYLFVLGAGLGASTRLGGGDYQRYIFPGVISLTMLFSTMFVAIAIVFDRQIGFLKAVLVSPVPRSSIAIGKIAAGAIQGWVQGLVLMPFAPLAGVRFGLSDGLELFCAMGLASTTFAAIGVAVASRFSSTTVFPIVSNTIILPMFFLSGALYPLQAAPPWMQMAAHFDPVAYAVDLMRGAVLGRHFFPPLLSVAALLCLIALLAWSAVRVFSRGEDDSGLGETKFKWRR